MAKTKELSLNDIKNKKVFLFSGEDIYSKEEAINSIIEYHFRDNEGLKDFNFNNYSDENINLNEISGILHSYPIMADNRIVYFSNIDKMPADLGELIQIFLKKKNDSTIIILNGTKIDKRKVFFKELLKNKNCISLEFKPKNEKEKLVWIQKYLREKNKKITRNALNMLSLNLSENLNTISSELDKLITFCNKEEIDEDTIEENIGISKTFNIFKLQTAIVNKNQREAIFIASNILLNKENKIDPIGINIYLSKIFVNALKIKSEAENKNYPVKSAAYNLGFNNPWRDQDIITCAEIYSLEELIKALDFFLEVDIKLKSNYLNPDLVLNSLIIKLCSSHREEFIVSSYFS